MKKIGIGIVGTGKRSISYGLQIEKKHSHQAQVLALADTNRVRMEAMEKQIGGEHRLYDDYRALLADDHITAVLVVTPDHTHEEIAIDSFRSGKHVLCEKPLSIDIPSSMRIVNAAEAAGRMLQIGFVLRYSPFFQKLRDIIQSGQIGKIVNVNFLHACDYRHGSSYFHRWHRLRKYSGDLLVTKGCHAFDILNYLVGSDPVRISAFGGTDIYLPRAGTGPRCQNCQNRKECLFFYDIINDQTQKSMYADAEHLDGYIKDICVFSSEKDSCDNAVAIIEYENSVRVNYTMSMISPDETDKIHIIGTNGDVSADLTREEIEIRVLKPRETVKLQIHGVSGGHGGGDEDMLSSFIECVMSDEKKPLANARAGLMSIAVAASAVKSIVEKRTINIAEELGESMANVSAHQKNCIQVASCK